MSRRQIYLKRISKVSSLPVLDRVSSEIKFILARLKFCLELDSNFQGKRIVSTLIILPVKNKMYQERNRDRSCQVTSFVTYAKFYQAPRIGILFNNISNYKFQGFSSMISKKSR